VFGALAHQISTMALKTLKRSIKHVAIFGLGWLFIALGVLGLFLPVLQGILFLLIGVSLLSMVSATARLVRMRIGRRFPALHRRLHGATLWIKARGRPVDQP